MAYKYFPADYNLCTAQNNGLNFLILEDFDGQSVIMDWDLSESEIAAIVEKFETIGLDDDDIQGDYDWAPNSETYDGLWGRTRLA